MKTTIYKQLLVLALSLYGYAGLAQCPGVTGLSVTQGTNATAMVQAIVSNSTIPSQPHFYWSVSPSATQTNAGGMHYASYQFYANGTYTVCVNFMDSLSSCSSSSCTVITITNTPTLACNAAFTFYNDSSCATHFVNSSVGSALTYQWYDMSNFSLLSTQQNPVLALGNGTHLIGLYTSASGQFCDSSTAYVNVACNTTGCSANSQFTVFADSSNAGSYFAYNASSGTGTLTYLWNFGDGTTSTQAYPFHHYAVPGQYIICLTVTATTGSVSCSDTYCDSSSVHRMSSAFLMSDLTVLSTPTALHENDVLKNLNAYPNPVENELIIETGESQGNEALAYVMTDALGKIILKGNFNGSKTFINTSSLERGFYVVSIISNQQKTLKTIKIVK